MAFHYFYGGERRLCRDCDVWRCFDLLVFPKRYSVHVLVVLCIEMVGLELPNYKSHKLAWNSLPCVMTSLLGCFQENASFCNLYGSQWRSCAGSTMFRFMHFPKGALVRSFFAFFPPTNWNLNFQFKNGPKDSSSFWEIEENWWRTLAEFSIGWVLKLNFFFRWVLAKCPLAKLYFAYCFSNSVLQSIQTVSKIGKLVRHSKIREKKERHGEKWER